MKNTERHWAWITLSLFAGASAWGFSCVEVEGDNPWILKGKVPTECKGIGDNTPCASLAGPCGIGKCNAAGLCEFTAVEMPMVPASANPCIQAQCVGGQLTEKPLSDGAPCTLGDETTKKQTFCLSGQCNAECFSAGDCKGEQAYCHAYHCATCNDGLKNGDETDVDCGEHCGKCQGDPCTDAATCKTGNCVDGVCCDELCDETCRACNVEEHVGECVNTPQYQDDLYPNNTACSGTKQCDGNGFCKSALNEKCSDASGCVSGYCLLDPGGPICKLNENAPCSKANEQDCFSGFCGDMNTCKKAPNGSPCIVNDQCASNSCNVSGNKKCN